MCRFLIAKFSERINPSNLLHKFAAVVKESKAPDGDWQGDGWGIAWIAENGWQSFTSLAPIWEDFYQFKSFPSSEVFAIHARSASFPDQRGIVEYNQPFVHGPYAFVFNGLLKGVSLSVPGRIGAQKIWHLLRAFLEKMPAEEALQKTKQTLVRTSKEIVGLNIGLCSPDQIYSLNHFTQHPDYYQLYRSETPYGKIISSEPVTDQSVILPMPGSASI